MNKISPVAILMMSVLWSNISFSNTCYTVEGEVETVNISAVNQSGKIKLVLFDNNDNKVFREKGPIIGTITGFANLYTTYLSHTALTTNGNTFITNNDTAVVTGIRKLAADGTPCSFYMHEVITNISAQTGFFANVNEVEIHADGYISSCIAEGENENEFELSGKICVN